MQTSSTVPWNAHLGNLPFFDSKHQSVTFVCFAQGLLVGSFFSFSRCWAIWLRCSLIRSLCRRSFSSCVWIVLDPKILCAKMKRNINASVPPMAMKLTIQKILSTSSSIPASIAISPSNKAQKARLYSFFYGNRANPFRQTQKTYSHPKLRSASGRLNMLRQILGKSRELV